MKGTLILVIGLVCLLTVQLGLITLAKAQSAMNRQGDLYGENQEGQMVFNWLNQDEAAEYIIYRSRSATGPWEDMGRVDIALRPGGEKVAVITSEASLMDLCYKVEAIDAAGIVIRTYSPICVPKFAP